MSKLDAFYVEGLVNVTAHAAEQAIARVPGMAGETVQSAGRWIAADVRHACETGLVYERRPKGFRVVAHAFGSPTGTLAPGQRFVLHPRGQHGWVVALEPPDVTVVTTLTRITPGGFDGRRQINT